MKLKNIVTFFITILLVSCHSVPVQGPTETATLTNALLVPSATVTLKPTRTRTATATPTETPIPTSTPTPESVSVPVMTHEKLESFDWETDFTEISAEEYFKLIKEPPVQEITFDDSTRPVQKFGLRKTPDGTSVSVQLTGDLKVNMFLQYAVAVDFGVGQEHVLIFKVVDKDPDGHNKLRTLVLNVDPVVESDHTYEENKVRKLAKRGRWQFNIVTRTKEYPTLSDLVNSIGRTNPIRQNFENFIIDDQTATVSLRATFIGYVGDSLTAP